MSVEASVNNKKKSKGFVHRALSFAMGTMASRVLGLFRDLAMAALFDRMITDAWAMAFRLPNFFRRLLGEGSLAAAITPVLVQSRVTSMEQERLFTQQCYSFLLLFIGALTLLIFIFASALLEFLVDTSFVQDSARFALSVSMLRVMAGFVFFVTMAAFMSALLQIRGHFGWTGLAPVLFNLTMLICTFVPASFFSQPGMGLAWGVLLGGALQWLLLWFLARRWNLQLQWRRPSWGAIRPFAVRLPMAFLSVGLLQILMLYNSFLASSLETGVLSRMYWADRLIELPLALIAVSLGTVALPKLSELISQKQNKEFASFVEQNLLYGAFFVFPAATGLWGLSELIVKFLFFRGEFSLADVKQTSFLLQFGAGILVIQAGYRLLLPAYQARRQEGHVVWAMVAGLVTHLLLAPKGLESGGVIGLMLVSLLSLGVAFGFLLVSYLKEFQWGHHESSSTEILKLSFASLFMGGFLSLLEERFLAESRWLQASSLILGAGLYVLILLWLRSRLLRLFWKRILNARVFR